MNSKPEPADPDEFARLLGARLRAARHATGMPLDAVEARSRGRFSAATVGSYERGTRAVTAQKLAELAAFYGADPAALLPTTRPRCHADPPTALEAAAASLRGAAQRVAEAAEAQRARGGDPR